MATKSQTILCTGPRIVHTIGHSTRTIEIFTDLLQRHASELLIDVRRFPASRRHPHFNREALASSLNETGIDYLWHGDLGGFRKPLPNSPNSAWQVGTFRAYADFMLTAEFDCIAKKIEALANAKRIALMCAEAVP